MTKEKFLTVRWNNLLSLGLGLTFLIYSIVALSTSVFSDTAGLIGLLVVGAVYWGVVEQHSNVWFAWQKNKSTSLYKLYTDTVSVPIGITNRLIYIAYNAIWWIPAILAFTKTIDYQTGFIAFFIYTLFRGGVNLYRNNILKPEQIASFPLRSP